MRAGSKNLTKHTYMKNLCIRRDYLIKMMQWLQRPKECQRHSARNQVKPKQVSVALDVAHRQYHGNHNCPELMLNLMMAPVTWVEQAALEDIGCIYRGRLDAI